MIKHKIVATTGTYTDRNGNEKRRYEQVGHIHEHDGRLYITLKATFNPAGLPRKEGDDRVFLNLFDPDERKESAEPGKPSGENNFDDDVPF